MFATFAVGVATSLILTPILRGALRRSGVVDVPNSRSLHTEVVVRGGGVAVVVAAILAVIVSRVPVTAALVGVVGCALVLGAVGFVDDRSGLSAGPRFAAQLIAPAVALPLLVTGTTHGGAMALVAIGAAILWSAAYVNAFNFMDGINGISTMQASVAGATFAILGASHDVRLLTAAGIAIAASAIGFAPYNVWRTSVFLGDVGSYFIGSWLASLLIVAVAQDVNLLVAMGPFLLYLADTSTTIVRRALKGENLLAAHREHAYQRLVQRGWSHLDVTLLAGLVMIATAGMMLAADDQSPPLLVGLFAAAVLLALSFTFLPNALDRLRPVTPS